MKIKSYAICSPIQGICKQYGIWVSGEKNSTLPLIYLQKPKHVNAEKWDAICNLQFYSFGIAFRI